MTFNLYSLLTSSEPQVEGLLCSMSRQVSWTYYKSPLVVPCTTHSSWPSKVPVTPRLMVWAQGVIVPFFDPRSLYFHAQQWCTLSNSNHKISFPSPPLNDLHDCTETLWPSVRQSGLSAGYNLWVHTCLISIRKVDDASEGVMASTGSQVIIFRFLDDAFVNGETKLSANPLHCATVRTYGVDIIGVMSKVVECCAAWNQHPTLPPTMAWLTSNLPNILPCGFTPPNLITLLKPSLCKTRPRWRIPQWCQRMSLW